MNHTNSTSSHRQSRDFRGGFTLVATLSMMVLLSILALGMLQLSALSLRASSQGDARETAKRNALVALNLAIAQLQRTAGPDQRITGPAKLASSEYPDSWSGVWTPGVLDGDTLTPPIAPVPDGSRNYLIDSRATNGDWKSSWFLEPLVSPDDGSSPEMVKLGQWSDTLAVEAPEVKLDSRGGLAWWTQDLSLQASLASGVNAEDAQDVGLASAPRVDVSRIADGRLDIDYFTDSKTRQKSVSLQSAMLAGNETETEPLGNAGNERSYGLFVDPVKGGLKADMTRFVESTSPDMGALANFGLTGIRAKSSMIPGSHHVKSGPQWERLRNWFKMLDASGEIAAANPDKIRQASDAYCGEGWSIDAIGSNKMPLHPVVVDAGFHWDFTPSDATSSRIRVHIYPRVTLWNPYNAPLAGNRYVIVMPRHIDTGGGLVVELEPPPGSSLPNIAPFNLINGGVGEEFNATGQASTNYFMFTLEATDFESGECLVFTPSTGSGVQAPYNASTPSSNILTSNQPVGSHNFYIEKTPLTNVQNLQQRIQQGYRVKRYASGSLRTSGGVTSQYNFVNWNPKPFFLKAARNGTIPASQVLQSSSYPTLQRLYLNDGGAGASYFEPTGRRSSYVAIHTGWNDTANNSGSPWIPFATNPDRRPPRSWYYRAHLSWIDDVAELAAAPAGVATPQPPYAAAAFADWNPIASVVSRTPSTYVKEFIDLHIGCWYRCKAPQEAFGPENTWGIFSNGKARGCPYGDPRNHAAKLSFPLIDVPNSNQPLQSIGTLRNVPLSPWTWHPVKIIGNSRPSLHADKDASAIPAIARQSKPWDSTLTQTDRVFDDIVQSADTAGEILLYDIAYETNREIWDATFASSWSNAAAWDGADRLPNRQYVLNPLLRSTETAITRSNTSPDDFGIWLSAYLLTSEGAFNVNSLSPSSWAAILGGLKNLPRTDAQGAELEGDHLFAKFNIPLSDDPEWGGGIGLSDDQITSLSEKIVEVVRERGPFLGMADFINRRLALDDTSNRGALDEALSRANLVDSSLSSVAATPDDSDTLVSGASRSRYENATNRLMEGAAGYLDQTDILEPLAGSLCARGDTFRIRASGSAYDAQGKLLSRAICEVIVVRSSEYMLPSAFDEPGSPSTGNSALVPPTTIDDNRFVANDQLNPINQKFGRRFEILSLKWLTTPSES